MTPMQLLQANVNRMTIRTTVLPTIVINDPLTPKSGQSVMQYLKPAVTLNVAGQDFTIAPYGDPGESKWPMFAGFAAFFGISWLLMAKEYV